MERLMYFIKLHSHMDPAIFRTPQDGAYCFNKENIKIDVRTSTLPTQNGEMISLRLFYYDQHFESLNNIGLSSKKLEKIRSLLTIPNGLILITGATGSGKSTTLYAMLRELTHRHVITLEDPIERLIPGIHQTSINEWQNYTMSVGLKALLRHNPDVIAIGEIRDSQTAEAVINAAYSGHLVIASLHTNSIETTLLRLANLGISPFMIGYCLRAIISQSLQFSEGKTKLKSELLICETPYIIQNLKKELNDFINKNSHIT
jgi:type II secretory ATPase GspE/PulE/Tfp pilus assembly ATPase PilB-like protein